MRSGSLMFTSESVAESHPDKIAAQISDRILDAFLARDLDVACEPLVASAQGLMFGYAWDETPDLTPLSIGLAHAQMRR